MDVANILDRVSKDGTKKTDYICEAVRFYYYHKDHLSGAAAFDDEALDKKVKELVNKYMNESQNEKSSTSNINLSGISKSDLEDD